MLYRRYDLTKKSNELSIQIHSDPLGTRPLTRFGLGSEKIVGNVRPMKLHTGLHRREDKPRTYKIAKVGTVRVQKYLDHGGSEIVLRAPALPLWRTHLVPVFTHAKFSDSTADKDRDILEGKEDSTYGKVLDMRSEQDVLEKMRMGAKSVLRNLVGFSHRQTAYSLTSSSVL
ncbi:hypothetical protein C8R42DRAFT_644245 [Lentinula raphanica]|nr:hypothetical protein C8R42DRAFT_644245 [Lentinula raphanica]